MKSAERGVSGLRTAGEADLEVVRRLLERAQLPTSDLAVSNAEFLVLSEEGRIVAAGALERFDSSALLRSVVVADDRRGNGLGRVIVRELEQKARVLRVSHLILLTETAVQFFSQQGYRVIERSNAPHEVQGSEEFRALCPASATCMLKVLTSSN